MKNKIYKHSLIKRLPSALLFLFIASASILSLITYNEYIKAKSTALQITAKLNAIFIDNENIANALAYKYAENLSNNECDTSYTLPSGKERKFLLGDVLLKGNDPQVRCMIDGLEFVNKKVTLTGNVNDRKYRYFSSPTLSILYSFIPVGNKNIDVKNLDVVNSKGVYSSTPPDFYDRFLSKNLMTKGMSSTAIYFDKMTMKKAYTLVSYVYDITKKHTIGYLYYDHTKDELNNIASTFIKKKHKWNSARLMSRTTGDSICFFGECEKTTLQYEKVYSDKYSVIMGVNIPTLLYLDVFSQCLFLFLVFLSLIYLFVSPNIDTSRFLHSIRDSLTNSYTRKALDYLVPGKYKYLILFDVNNLKVINDQHGHDAGDMALKKITDVVNENIRKNDVLIRFGGDEFIIFITSKIRVNIDSLAERLSAEVMSNHIIVANDQLIQLSISWGTSIFNNSIDESIKEADKNMYIHKVASKSVAA